RRCRTRSLVRPRTAPRTAEREYRSSQSDLHQARQGKGTSGCLRRGRPSRLGIEAGADYLSHCPDPPEAKRFRRSIAAQGNGRKGGLVRAELYGESHRREWGRLGGLATKSLYGSDFFRTIRQRRFTYRKGYMTKKTKL